MKIILTRGVIAFLFIIAVILVVISKGGLATVPSAAETQVPSKTSFLTVDNTANAPTVTLSDFQSVGCTSKAEIDFLARSKVHTAMPVKICTAPQVIIDQTNKYLASLLGEKYVKDYIDFVPSATEQLLNRRDGKVYWNLAYTDSRFVRKLGQKKSLRFSIHIEDHNHEIVKSSFLPDCVHDESPCLISITEEQALATAKTAGLNDNNYAKFEHHIDFAKNSGTGWAWYLMEIIPREKGKICGTSKTVEINISTGKTPDLMVGKEDCLQITSF